MEKGQAMVLHRLVEGHVEILTLNRPRQCNALSLELIEALSGALAAAKANDTTRVVILTGAGDRAFCSGMDLKAFAADAMTSWPTQAPAAVADFVELTRGNFPKPVIAAVNGTAVGAGFDLVLGCDLVVAAKEAEFGLPEVRRGMFSVGGSFALPARIPLAIALELGLTGYRIDAGRALALGLVNRVVPPDAVLPTALDLADSIGDNSPLAVAVTKKLMRTADECGAAAAQRLATDGYDAIFGSGDPAEGARAFTEKRQPRWSHQVTRER
jgi:enoyl-CoA hydratase